MKKAAAVKNVKKATRQVKTVGAWNTPEAIKGLNPKLVMYIAAATYANTGIEGADYDDNEVVRCLVEDMEFSVESQYSTPFQESDPQSKLPTLHAVLSTGMALDFGAAIGAISEETEVNDSQEDASLTQKAITKIEGMMHKTSFSKINSTQVYGSSSSIRLSGTIMLVAWDNAAEVEQALKLLQAWTAPTVLSKDSAAANVINSAADGWDNSEGVMGGLVGMSEGALDGLYSSVVPPIVTVLYGNKKYKDFHIESVSAPITAPMNDKGERIAVKVQISFISRKAWDRGDIETLYAK